MHGQQDARVADPARAAGQDHDSRAGAGQLRSRREALRRGARASRSRSWSPARRPGPPSAARPPPADRRRPARRTSSPPQIRPIRVRATPGAVGRRVVPARRRLQDHAGDAAAGVRRVRVRRAAARPPVARRPAHQPAPAALASRAGGCAPPRRTATPAGRPRSTSRSSACCARRCPRSCACRWAACAWTSSATLLRARGLPADDVARVLSVLEACDEARFSPGGEPARQAGAGRDAGAGGGADRRSSRRRRSRAGCRREGGASHAWRWRRSRCWSGSGSARAPTVSTRRGGAATRPTCTATTQAPSPPTRRSTARARPRATSRSISATRISARARSAPRSGRSSARCALDPDDEDARYNLDKARKLAARRAHDRIEGEDKDPALDAAGRRAVAVHHDVVLHRAVRRLVRGADRAAPGTQRVASGADRGQPPCSPRARC